MAGLFGIGLEIGPLLRAARITVGFGAGVLDVGGGESEGGGELVDVGFELGEGGGDGLEVAGEVFERVDVVEVDSSGCY